MWLHAVMSDLQEVFRRLANDHTFGDALRNDPVTALRNYRLSGADLRRLEKALSGSPCSVEDLLSTSPRRRTHVSRK